MGSAETPSEVDLLIVGAGPTGLFAADYAGFLELSTAAVDSLPEPGGQVTAMYPEKKIFDVAGFPVVLGRDLVASLVEQADQFKPTYLLGKRARTLSEVDGKFEVGLDGGSVVRAGAILITAGMGEFTPRPLPAGGGWRGRRGGELVAGAGRRGHHRARGGRGRAPPAPGPGGGRLAGPRRGQLRAGAGGAARPGRGDRR